MSDTDRSQDTPFTIKGHWWLPGSSHRVAGDLVYSVTEMTLVLYGGLNEAIVESPFTAIPEQNEFPIIHGESLKKVPITILKSFYTKWMPDITTLAVQPGTRKALLSSVLSCHTMLEGVHLESPDDTFAKCRIEIPNFEEWLGDSPFAFNVAPAGDNVQIEYSRPRNEQFQLDACNCRVSFVRAVTLPGIPLCDPSIKHRACVEMEATEAMPLNWFCNQAAEVVGLFSFMYGGSVLSRRLTVFRRTAAAEELSLFYTRPDSTLAERNATEIVVRYENVKDVFPRLLSNWLTASEGLETARRILVNSELRPSKLLDRQFLRLMASAEVLARESNQCFVIDEEAFDGLKEQMFGVLRREFSSDVVASISIRRQKANQLPLHSRLFNMVNALQDETCRLFCLDKAEFIQGIVTSRNYYTHHSAKKRVLRRVELHWTIRKLSVMLRVLLLLRAGVPEDVLQQLVKCHHRLRGDRAVWSTITEEGSPINEIDDD